MTHKTYQHQTLEESEITLNSILDLIVEGVWDWNATSRQVTRSPNWYHMLGYELGVFREDVFTWENIIHPEDYPQVMAHFEAYISGKSDKYEIEYRCKKADDTYLWIIDRGKIIEYSSDGSVSRMIGAHQDIHQHKMDQQTLLEQNKLLQADNLSLEKISTQKHEELQAQIALLEKKVSEIESISNTDPLTLIANRKSFEEALKKEIIRSARYNHPLSLAIFDIDLFKVINDKYGHKVGDKILCQITTIVSKNIRQVDLFARWGGDEFVIIFPEQNKSQAHISCEKLRSIIRQLEVIKDISVSCSFGVSQYQKTDNFDTLFHRVDSLLYQAKENGRDSVKS